MKKGVYGLFKLLNISYKETMNFEENVEQLEKVVQELENGNLNLEDSIKKFEEGMAISKKCNEILEEAEKKITVLIKKDDGVEEEDFE